MELYSLLYFINGKMAKWQMAIWYFGILVFWYFGILVF